jgi:hypothetical protein
MGVLTVVVEKRQIPVFAMKDTEEFYAMNQFASKFKKSNVSFVSIH